jgi:hypothetical protein
LKATSTEIRTLHWAIRWLHRQPAKPDKNAQSVVLFYSQKHHSNSETIEHLNILAQYVHSAMEFLAHKFGLLQKVQKGKRSESLVIYAHEQISDRGTDWPLVVVALVLS